MRFIHPGKSQRPGGAGDAPKIPSERKFAAEKLAEALAVARGGAEWCARDDVFRAFRTELGLLDRPHAAARGGLVFRRGD